MVVQKSLTYDYLRFRSAHKSKKYRFGSSLLGSTTSGDSSGKEHLLQQNEEDNGIQLTHSLPPLWVDIVDNCREDVTAIKEKMSQLQKAQQRRLLKVFDDVAGDHPERELESLINAITQLFKQCERRVHELKVKKTANLPKEEYTQRKNAQVCIHRYGESTINVVLL